MGRTPSPNFLEASPSSWGSFANCSVFRFSFQVLVIKKTLIAHGEFGLQASFD